MPDWSYLCVKLLWNSAGDTIVGDLLYCMGSELLIFLTGMIMFTQLGWWYSGKEDVWKLPAFEYKEESFLLYCFIWWYWCGYDTEWLCKIYLKNSEHKALCITECCIALDGIWHYNSDIVVCWSCYLQKIALHQYTCMYVHQGHMICMFKISHEVTAYLLLKVLWRVNDMLL